jgi:dynein heavy chain
LEEEFKQQNFEKQNLAAQIEECKLKLDRALRLTGGLGNERARWVQAAEKLTIDKENLLGDIILSSSIICYLGPFTGRFRDDITKSLWMPKVKEIDIQGSEEYNFLTVMGDQIKIQSWTLKGLPSNQVSIENMLVIQETPQKWPLLVDP